jgi:hypothetical protein
MITVRDTDVLDQPLVGLWTLSVYDTDKILHTMASRHVSREKAVEELVTYTNDANQKYLQEVLSMWMEEGEFTSQPITEEDWQFAVRQAEMLDTLD